ncbi:hypothetical protein Tco_0770914 [Tanacetum coccineum]|uniref:Uncharacterized protein n=1 Tax=Tanacetum coccineum TaxID=301880 RepID=A0ABQ4ZHB1_9ASTR
MEAKMLGSEISDLGIEFTTGPGCRTRPCRTLLDWSVVTATSPSRQTEKNLDQVAEVAKQDPINIKTTMNATSMVDSRAMLEVKKIKISIKAPTGYFDYAELSFLIV